MFSRREQESRPTAAIMTAIIIGHQLRELKL
jgi:hypothetical protein